MFGEIAVQLLKMMGHSGTVPSALRAGDIPAALARLRQELAAIPEAEARHSKPADNEDAEPPVTLRTRALPLIELLSAAEQQECDVLWDAGAPLV